MKTMIIIRQRVFASPDAEAQFEKIPKKYRKKTIDLYMEAYPDECKTEGDVKEKVKEQYKKIADKEKIKH